MHFRLCSLRDNAICNVAHSHGVECVLQEGRVRGGSRVGCGGEKGRERRFKGCLGLQGYYAYGKHDETTADAWLRRAAHLKYPEAEYSLAIRIKDFGFAPDGFGSDEGEAVHSLLAELAPTDGRACYEMADAYRKGYFGRPDEVEARHYLEIGAKLNDRMCWEELFLILS